MRIVIECGNPQGCTEREIRYTLMDALAEFQSNRGPTAEAYIERRYPADAGYSWLDREAKAKEVNRRKWLAEDMRCSIVSIEDVEDKEST